MEKAIEIGILGDAKVGDMWAIEVLEDVFLSEIQAGFVPFDA
jgi:hypothetical protein